MASIGGKNGVAHHEEDTDDFGELDGIDVESVIAPVVRLDEQSRRSATSRKETLRERQRHYERRYIENQRVRFALLHTWIYALLEFKLMNWRLCGHRLKHEKSRTHS